MTEREAIKVCDGLRKAFRSIKPGEQVPAQNVLAQSHVISWALLQHTFLFFRNQQFVDAVVKFLAEPIYQISGARRYFTLVLYSI
jgi:hypothetical protein